MSQNSFFYWKVRGIKTCRHVSQVCICLFAIYSSVGRKVILTLIDSLKKLHFLYLFNKRLKYLISKCAAGDQGGKTLTLSLIHLHAFLVFSWKTIWNVKKGRFFCLNHIDLTLQVKVRHWLIWFVHDNFK